MLLDLSYNFMTGMQKMLFIPEMVMTMMDIDLGLSSLEIVGLEQPEHEELVEEDHQQEDLNIVFTLLVKKQVIPVILDVA